MPTALVTGGAGFIGSHLVRRLIADDYFVHIVDDLSTGGRSPSSTGSDMFKFTNYKVDISDMREYAYFKNWFEFVGGTEHPNQFDVIFHLAAVSRTPPTITDPLHCLRVNVNGSVNVLEFARQRNIPRVVLSSSNVVYAADTPYKASKLSMEYWAAAYTAMYNVSTICLRYSNVYGSYIRKGDLACLAALRDSADANGYIEITGDGEQSRDFTHVSDIVEGNIQAARCNYTGVVDLCTGINSTMNEVVRKIERDGKPYSLQFDCPIHYVGERRGDIKHIRQDPGPAFEILNWRAKIELQKGIQDVWTY